MAVVTGFQDVTSGERASEEFDFGGGRCGYMVVDVPNTTPDWDLQMQLPDDTWQNIGVANNQVDSAKPYASIANLPAARFRLHCDNATAGNYTPVSLYWCYVPIGMQDAALF